MRPLYLNAFLALAANAEGLASWIDAIDQAQPNLSAKTPLVDDPNKKWISQLREECKILGLTGSSVTLRKMSELVDQPGATLHALRPLLTELHGRLMDETGETFFFALAGSEVEHFKDPRCGWERVIARFENTVGDIEEARKCYALSRYAASVFHSLQVVEACLIELGTFIGVRDRKSGWTPVTARLQKIVDTPYSERDDFARGNYDFLEQVNATARALKHAWRNKVSHAQGKLVVMTADFAPEIAEEILMASRAFARSLAEGLPPAGTWSVITEG